LEKQRQIELDCISELYKSFKGKDAESIAKLKGDASMRSIYRIKENDSSIIAVYGPNLEENRAFIGFIRTFIKLGLPVPDLLAVDDSKKCYLLEDLGDTTLFKFVSKSREDNGGEFPFSIIEKTYKNVVDGLVKFQTLAANEIDYSLCYQTEVFDEDAWLFDHNYFLNSFVELLLPDYPDRLNLEKDLERHREILNDFPRDNFLYRDFQSRNVMVTDKGLRFIDFQSGRRGAVLYDIVSLLFDAKADLPYEFREKIFNYFKLKISSETGISVAKLEEYYAPYALLRVLQALGSYGNNGIRNGKAQYLESIPYALNNLRWLLENDPRLRDFKSLLWLLNYLEVKQPWKRFLKD